MDDSNQTVESTSLNFRVRVEFESLTKCDSSPSFDSDSPIPDLKNQNKILLYHTNDTFRLLTKQCTG
jgi:hypothetical protein